MQDVRKLFGKRVRELRKIRNLTQERLAEFLDIGPANVSYIETGRFSPSPENLVKLAKALNVEIYELYLFNGTKTSDEMKDEIVTAIENDETILNKLYNFYKFL